MTEIQKSDKKKNQENGAVPVEHAVPALAPLPQLVMATAPVWQALVALCPIAQRAPCTVWESFMEMTNGGSYFCFSFFLIIISHCQEIRDYYNKKPMFFSIFQLCSN